MSTREDGPESPLVESKSDLVEYIAAGGKPREQWRIGTEHEKFAFDTRDLRPIPYEGPAGVRALLEGMINRFGWEAIREGDNIIALKRAPGVPGGGVSLEPGGQIELSGEPLASVHETCKEVAEHRRQVLEIGRDLGIGFMGLGFQPKWTLAETPMMPKGRYKIMKEYMPKVGTLGLDMMFRSCTIQVNLDFADEADMRRKMRVGLALQPLATALFANSPFTEGRTNGFQSFRSEIWRNTDPERTGMLDFAFEEGFGYESYVDYALEVPMYFVYRNGRYIDATRRSFRDFMEGKLDVLPGERPTIADWADHLSTLFPEVRMKRFLEMRGADGGPWGRVCALPAFWVGLLYDEGALDEACELIRSWGSEERQRLRDEVPVGGLRARIGGRSAREVAGDVLAIAKRGLAARGNIDRMGSDERQYLVSLERVVETGETSADRLVRLFHTTWGGDIDRAFVEEAF
ncbi:MAG: glutamate--cysteine ligase [Rhizobiales bacterium]|nr:glutamate--cysteine ligase [Hyphomicrobiales bacterium]